MGGSPSAGKTAFALQLAFHMAKERRVGFFSYETSVDKLHDRGVRGPPLAVQLPEGPEDAPVFRDPEVVLFHGHEDPAHHVPVDEHGPQHALFRRREIRRQKKKPLRTRRAAVILTGRLDRLSGGERKMKLELLDTAILHGWDFYVGFNMFYITFAHLGKLICPFGRFHLPIWANAISRFGQPVQRQQLIAGGVPEGPVP